ncbi:MAG: YceD family protein [Gammaproteobacteria bacterium]
MARVAGLPERIDPLRLVERAGRLCGHLSLARMERLAASLCDGEGTVFIDVCFQRDEQGRELAVGHVTARLPVRCQRCLEAMEIAIATALRVAFTHADTHAESEAPPPDGYDAVPLVGDTISLVELVEDELMLALPMAPMHEDCPVGVWRRYLGVRAPSETPLKPFAALSRIRRPAG